MEKLYTKEDCLKFREKYLSVGFAPTMGNLHEGHISLLKQALSENESAVISIYVNPTQFAAGEDFDNYPRTLEEDLEKIEKLQSEFPNKMIGVFLPSTETMYPSGEEITIKIPELSQILEGKHRPTHFDGVTTIVNKLFNFVGPTKAYFGQKDYQQLQVIKKMTKVLKLETEIISMSIVRDEDGLAMSSRNRYLSKEERSLALTLPKTLNLIESLIKKNEFRKVEILIKENLLNDNKWNYLELRSTDLMNEVKNFDQDVVVLGNYQLGKTKLLDNRIIKKV